MKKYRGLVAVCLTLMLAGCGGRKVSVESVPAGAEIYVDDQHIGRTPCIYVDKSKAFGTDLVFRVELAGYQPIQRVFKQEAQAGKMATEGVFGALCCFPVLCFMPWSYNIPESIRFELVPLKSDPAPQETKQSPPPGNGP